MRTVRATLVKKCGVSKYAGTLVICIMLASCSSSQIEFLAKRNTLISQGYTWQKLDRCRPAKENAPSIPIIGPDGEKLVCYELAPPQNGTAANMTSTTPPKKRNTASVTQTPAPTTPSKSKKSLIIWNFSNFWSVWHVAAKHVKREHHFL